MEQPWVLTGAGRRLLQLTVRPEGAGAPTIVHPVLTVADVCRRLGKSRRQVYRYVRAGRLPPAARVLGQWLFAPSTVDRSARPAVPSRLRRFFWDVRLSELSVDQHRDFIVARVLESGDREALRWLLRTYSRDALTAFLSGRGAELLTRRAWTFWCLFVGLNARRDTTRRSWRYRGRVWGGVG